MKNNSYLYHMYCKVKDRIQRESKSYNQIKMCTCIDCDGWNGNSFCMISLYINSLESMAIFFSFFFLFFMDLHVPIFFLILGPSCVHFFSRYPMPLFFNKNWRETNTYSGAFILWNEWMVQC